MPQPRGEKTKIVKKTVAGISGDFSVADLQRKLPGVSVDMIRRILKDMQAEGAVRCLSRGRSAKWRKT